MATNSIGDIPSLLQIIPTETEEAAFATLIVQGIEIFLHDGDSEFFIEYKKSLGKILSYAFAAFKQTCYFPPYVEFSKNIFNFENYPSCVLYKNKDIFDSDYFRTRGQYINKIYKNIPNENIKRWHRFSDAADSFASLRQRMSLLLDYLEAIKKEII